ncbi:5-formyltetrahydrofolate cyclo-ligase [Erysipelotrichaceae bacterium OH741_COT-311]|nr:5-formyltetrahydrofolate cyclo-ligase [Erysipelotrichaceae bacterium OH741_COT-311]
MDKASIRKSKMFLRRALSKEDKALFDMDIFKQAITYINKNDVVGVYVSRMDEVDTFLLINYLLKHCIKVAVPRVVNQDLIFYKITDVNQLEEGHFHLLEPTTNLVVDNISIMFVPMLAYDQYNHRIGYGKGFYDRYFASHLCFKIGLAYDFYFVDFIETNETDVKLDVIIVNKR